MKTQTVTILEKRNLTQKVVSELLEYDPSTGLLFWKIRSRKWFDDDRASKIWNIIYPGKVAGGKTGGHRKEYISISIFKKRYLAHRIIWLHVNGRYPNNQIDHIDGDGTNNKIENLRDVSQVENCRNMKLSSANKSGHTGIYLRKDTGKWAAEIWDGKKICLGSFSNISEAINVRVAAEKCLNFHKNHGSVRPLYGSKDVRCAVDDQPSLFGGAS